MTEWPSVSGLRKTTFGCRLAFLFFIGLERAKNSLPTFNFVGPFLVSALGRDKPRFPLLIYRIGSLVGQLLGELTF